MAITGQIGFFMNVSDMIGNDVVGKLIFDFVHPEDIENVLKEFSGLIATTRPARVECRAKHANGHYVWLETVGDFLRNDKGEVTAVVMTSRDITDHKQAEKVLRESEEKYRILVENISDVVYEMDSSGVVIYVSPVIEDIMGYDPADIVGKNFIEFIYRDDRSRLMEWFSELRKGIEYPFEYRFISKSGGIRWIRTNTKPIMEGGDFKGARGTCMDITERKLAEENLRKTLERLRRAIQTTIQVMVSAVETRDPYTAGHQLRSANLARTIAKEMGLSQDTIEALRMASPIHDIGKLSIPAEILSKPKKLTEIDFSLI